MNLGLPKPSACAQRVEEGLVRFKEQGSWELGPRVVWLQEMQEEVQEVT